MYCIVWRYEVDATHAAAFKHAYGQDGPWVALFRGVPGWIATSLFEGTIRRFRQCGPMGVGGGVCAVSQGVCGGVRADRRGMRRADPRRIRPALGGQSALMDATRA